MKTDQEFHNEFSAAMTAAVEKIMATNPGSKPIVFLSAIQFIRDQLVREIAKITPDSTEDKILEYAEEAADIFAKENRIGLRPASLIEVVG